MADLNHGDIQRAVQDGVRQLQSNVQRLLLGLSSVSNQADRIDDIELIVRDLQRVLHTMQSTAAHLSMTTASHDPRIAQITSDIHELKQRFAVIERFAAQMSAYVQAKYEEEQADRGYRDS